jgi:hypothetical protein
MNTVRAKLRSVFSFSAAAAALLITACGFSLSSPAAASGSASDPPGIVGTWLVTVTPAAPGTPFQSTLVYTRDGAVIEATSRSFMAPTADTSEGLGVWSETGASVHVTFQKYLFNSQGNYIGRTVIVDTDTLDHQGTTFSGKALATFYDVNGNVLATIASSTSGQRMNVSA